MKTNANRIIVKKKKNGNGRKEERERKEKRGEKDRKTKRKEERKGGKILSLREMQMEKLFSFSHEVLQETRLHFQTEFPTSFQ